MQALPSHGHPDFTGNRGGTEARLELAVLQQDSASQGRTSVVNWLTSRMNTGRPSSSCSDNSRIER